jgi:Tol biopolymer transport system component
MGRTGLDCPPSCAVLSSLRLPGVRPNILVHLIAIVAGLAVGVGCGSSPDVLLPEPTARVRGLILAPDLSRVPAAKVQLEPVGTPPCKFDTFTRVDGSYELDGICPGLYDLVAIGRSPDPDNPGQTLELRARVRFIQLTAGQTALLPDLVLVRASNVIGTVILQGRPTNAGATVTLIGTNRTATTDAAGAFRIENVEEGTYAINIAAPGFIERSINGLVVPANSNVTLNEPFVLQQVNPPNAGTIAGTVTLETRTDHSGVLVRVDGTDRSVLTTIGGNYTFPNLPISTYSLTFSKRNFFDKQVGPLTLVPGQTLLAVPSVQLDSHRVLSRTIPAFDVEHAPPGTQIIRATALDSQVSELAVTDPTANVFNQVLTQSAFATPFAGISWSPDTNDILFIRSFLAPTNSSSIGVIKNDGSGLRNLLPQATQYLAPAWSPDGTRFAYFLNPDIRTIQVDRSTGTLVATTATSASVQVENGVVSFSGMEWSASGRIVYSFHQNTAGGLRSAGIFTIFATGGGRLQVTPRTPAGLTISTPESPTFRPDFGRIAFSWRDTPAPNEPPNGIYVMDLDGLNATRITTVPGINLDWSPDGTRVVFTRGPLDPLNPNRLHEVLVPRD